MSERQAGDDVEEHEPVDGGAGGCDIESPPHHYTVDVILHGAEPHPCCICGQGRQAAAHQQPRKVNNRPPFPLGSPTEFAAWAKGLREEAE